MKVKKNFNQHFNNVMKVKEESSFNGSWIFFLLGTSI
jgi:hypothetical protein